MDKKNSFNITLAGKSYTLCGNESQEYLQSVGSYIEEKYHTFSKNMSFHGQNMEMQHILMQLNIADDYFKCREELAVSRRKETELEAELEALKQSMVAMQVQCENLDAAKKNFEKKYQEAKKKLSRCGK